MKFSVLNPGPMRAAQSASASPWPQPDFMPARPQASAWMWACLALAALVLGPLLLQQQSLRAQRQSLDEQWQLLDQLSATAGAGRAKLADAPSASSPSAELQARAWALASELRPELGKDWASRWLAVEQALPPGLQMQALEMQGRSLRLEGSAIEAERVMQLVDRLAQQARAQPGSEVVLTRLQKPEGGAEPGAAPAQDLRFEVVQRPAQGTRSAAGAKGQG